MFVDECHVTRPNQGLFSTTMEAEKRDPGNEVGEGKMDECQLLDVIFSICDPPYENTSYPQKRFLGGLRSL